AMRNSRPLIERHETACRRQTNRPRRDGGHAARPESSPPTLEARIRTHREPTVETGSRPATGLAPRDSARQPQVRRTPEERRPSAGSRGERAGRALPRTLDMAQEMLWSPACSIQLWREPQDKRGLEPRFGE